MAHKIVAQSGDGSEASWKVSWKVIEVGSAKQQSFQSSDVIFESISAPANLALHGSGSHIFLESGGNRTEIQSGDLGSQEAFNFLLQTLEATISDAQKRLAALKLVAPKGKGNIIRSDILPRRLQDIEYISRTVAFAQPLQVFDENWTTSTSFVDLFKGSIGAIRLNEGSSSQAIEEALGVLESELHNRLSMSLVVAGLKRQTLAFVEGGDSLPYGGYCSRAFYDAAKSLGVDVVVLAVEGHTLQTPDYVHWRKDFVPLECGYDDGFPARIVAAVKSYGAPIDGLLTMHESYHVFVSEAAKELGLPHEPVSAYEIATNKYKTSAFENRRSFTASNAEEAIKIAETEDVPWPIIIKPCRGWASELVFKVDNIEQLKEAAPRMDSDRHGNQFVMEHYCDGPEIDINIAMYDGEVLFWDMGDESPKGADGGSESFGELDFCLPTQLPQSEQKIVRDSMVSSMTKMGFRNGVYHCEARVDNSTMEWRSTDSGVPELVPRQGHNGKAPTSWLIEINTRPGGLNINEIMESTWGVDYWALLSITKLPNAADRARALSTPYVNGAQYFANMMFIPAIFDLSKKGIWESDSVTEELIARRPDIAKHISKHYTFQKRGDVIPHMSSGINRFVAYIHMFSRKSMADVLAISQEARRELRIEYS